MNILERAKTIYQRLDALRFGQVDHSKDEQPIEKFDPFKFNFDLAIKPPISHYLDRQTLDKLASVTYDPKLMNKPSQKFKLMNEILAPMKMKPLASGTNRRAFYCEYDPTIVLKVGSDTVGRSDNISEYYTQNLIKPYCCKIYSITPDGMVSLGERGEPIKKDDFQVLWSGEVFKTIMKIVYKGYSMEDIGGNYFKNWAVRLGFGPMLIDFPYIYEIDGSKLTCDYVNPRTGEHCCGQLDYDYSKGMSEIVCEKCGRRYSALHLAKTDCKGKTRIVKGRVFNMANLKDIKVSLRRGDTVVYSSYCETGIIPAKNNPISAKIEKRSEHRNQERQQQKAVSENNREDINNDITMFLDSIYVKYGKQEAINLARKLGLYYISAHERERSDSTLPQRNPNREQRQQIIQQPKQKPDYKARLQRGKTEESEKPKSQLYPVKPKTREEIEAEDNIHAGEKAPLGIPGEPIVVTMRFNEAIPKIKQTIIDKFDHKIELIDGSEDKTLDKLKRDISDLIVNEITRLTNSDTKGLEVYINGSHDIRNKKCYAIRIAHYKSPILETTLYPVEDGSNNDENVKKIAEGINLLYNEEKDSKISKIKNTIIDFISVQLADEEGIGNEVLDLLIADLTDTKEDVNPSDEL